MLRSRYLGELGRRHKSWSGHTMEPGAQQIRLVELLGDTLNTPQSPPRSIDHRLPFGPERRPSVRSKKEFST